MAMSFMQMAEEAMATKDLERERKIRTRVAAWIGSRLGDNRTDAHSTAGTTAWG